MMNLVLKSLSVIGLILTLLPSFLVFTGTLTLDAHKVLMFIGSALWFVTAPFWMNKKA